MKDKKGAIIKEAKSGEVQKLKNQVRNLEKKNKLLISKLNTAEKALGQNIKFLKDTTEDISLEVLLDAAKDNKSLKEIEDNKCPQCGKNELKIIKTLFGAVHSCKCGFMEKRVNE